MQRLIINAGKYHQESGLKITIWRMKYILLFLAEDICQEVEALSKEYVSDHREAQCRVKLTAWQEE